MRKFLSERERQRDPFEKCTQTRDAHPALLSITIPYPKLVGLRIHIKRITYIQRFPGTQESDCVTSLLTGLKRSRTLILRVTHVLTNSPLSLSLPRLASWMSSLLTFRFGLHSASPPPDSGKLRSCSKVAKIKKIAETVGSGMGSRTAIKFREK